MFDYTSDFEKMLGEKPHGEKYNIYPCKLGEKRDIISEIGACDPTISYRDFLKHYYLHGTWFIPGLPEQFKREYGLSDEQEALFELLLENAIVHGNKNDPNKPINIVVLKGKRTALKMTDQGHGFSHTSFLEDFKKRRPYSEGLGTGTRFAAKCTQSLVRYNSQGNSIKILFLNPDESPRPYLA